MDTDPVSPVNTLTDPLLRLAPERFTEEMLADLG